MARIESTTAVGNNDADFAIARSEIDLRLHGITVAYYVVQRLLEHAVKNQRKAGINLARNVVVRKANLHTGLLRHLTTERADRGDQSKLVELGGV